MLACGIPNNLSAYGLRHVRKIQTYLNKKAPGSFRIAIFDWESFGKIVYKGPRARKEIYLVLNGGHFEPIAKPAELFKVCTFFP